MNDNKNAGDDEKARRLAAALRENLRRRKAQARATGDAGTDAPAADKDDITR